MKFDLNSLTNCFPGLRPFRTEEYHLFFGRDEQTAALLGLLREHRFLAVVGTSGSGKSSLVRAGLIPALHRGSMARAGTSWAVVVMRPGGHPISSLAKALIEADLYDCEDPETLPRLRATLSRSLYGLTEAARQSIALDPDTKLLIVVDQFEELFRFREQGVDSEEAATAFVNLLLAAAEAQERRIYVAITMRSDYLGDCAQIPGLAEAVNRGEYLIPRLTRDQRRDAVEKPVGVGGAKIAPRLVQHMLNDVGDDPDQLPVLQHALMRTWDAWAIDHGEGEPLDLRHYETTGGMAEALSRHADEVFAELPDDDHRSAAERVFKALTVKGPDNRGIRRPTRLGRLAQIVGASEETVRNVVEAYRRPGVTFLMPGASSVLAPETVIDLSHESLMRVWRRLSVWVDEEAQSARIYRRLAETAALWERKEAGLYHEPDLQIAWSWRETSRPGEAWAEQYGGGFALSLAFLEQSRADAVATERAREAARERELEQAKQLAEAERRRLEVQKRASRRLRAFAAGLGVVAALAVGAFFNARWARHDAINNSVRAAASEAAAKKAARELERTLVHSDFEQGVKHLEASESEEGLPHLARALRTDPGYSPAKIRTLSTLDSGRFSFKSFPVLKQERVITTYLWNKNEDLLFTSDAGDGVEEPERLVWDARKGERLYRVAAGVKVLRSPSWSEDGSLLVAYLEQTRTVQAWEARTGKELPPIVNVEVESFRLGQHPVAGEIILLRHPDGSMRVYRARTGEAVGGREAPRLETPTPATDQMEISPDGRRVVGCCTSSAVAVWDSLTGSLVAESSTRPYRLTEDSRRDQVGGLFFSPDSAFMVARAADGKHVTWWRVDEPNPAPIWLELPALAEVQFLPGGDKVAFVSNTRTTPLRVLVHNLATRAETARIESSRPVGAVFGPRARRDGSLGFPLLGSVDANVVRVWDLETGGVLREIFTPWLLMFAEVSPEGRRILTVSTARELMVWDLFTGAQLWSDSLKIPAGWGQFSPDGEKLMTFDGARSVLEIRDARTGRPLREAIPMSNFTGVHFPSGGRQALVWELMHTTIGSQFSKQTLGRFHLFDLGLRPQLFESLQDGAGTSAAAALTPDGGIVVTHGRQSTQGPHEVRAYDARTRRILWSLPLPANVFGYQDTLKVSPDGRLGILACSDSRVRIYDLERAATLHELIHEQPVLAAAISPDGTLVCTGTDAGAVRVWNLLTGAPLFESVAHGEQPLQTLCFSPDGRLIATGSRDFKLRVLEARTGKAHFEPVAFSNVVQQVAWSKDGAYLAVVPFDPQVSLIAVATGTLFRKLDQQDSCRTGVFSPDGTILAVSTGSNFNAPFGQVTLWSWREGRRLGRPLETRGSVGDLNFSADGALLATSTLLPTGGAVQVWDVESGLPVTDAVVGRRGGTSVDFRAGAAEVIAAWADGTVRVIDLPRIGEVEPEKLARLAEAVAGKRIAGKGGIDDVPQEELQLLRQEAGPAWWQWFFSEAEDRTISPGSKVTLREYLARLRRSSVLEDLQDALRLAPDDGLTHARLGLLLLDQLVAGEELDRQKETAASLRRHWQNTAVWYAERAVELEPQNAEAWAINAEVLQRLGRKTEAARAVTRALELDPRRADESSPNARYLQALTLAQEGKWAEADQSFGAALDALAANAARTDGAPLLGVLAEVAPVPTPAGYREITLPAPIPGTFESFDSTPEGSLPPGWTAQHERPRAGAVALASGRIDQAESDIFEDWTVVGLHRVATSANPNGPPFYRDRLLARSGLERVNGVMPESLLTGHFLFSLSAGREVSCVQRILTPSYDCSDRSGVHLVFKSSTQQAGEVITALEYSIDGGKSWLPVDYRLNVKYVVLDASGRIDAEATLTRPKTDAPYFIDDDGRPRGTNYGEFLGARPSRALDPYLQGVRRDLAAEGKRIELYRLEAADGQARVQLRFLHAGRFGWYWAIDDLGLYVLEPSAINHPATIDRTRDPGFLSSRALAVAYGSAAERGDFGAESNTDETSAPDGARDQPAPEDPRNAARRRALDAFLLARRALALAPGSPGILANEGSVAVHAGYLDEARRLLRDLPAGEALNPPHARSFLAFYRRWALELDASGDGNAATVLDEASHVLEKALLGRVQRLTLERLARVGLVAEQQVILARGSEWAYLDNGIDPGPTWKDPGFDDSAWPRGPARFGYGGDGEKTVISFGPNQREKYITTYFRAETEVLDPGRFLQLKLSVARDDGVIVYLNGQEVVRDNLPAGEVGPQTPATATVNDEDEKRFFAFDISIPLRPGKNVVAAELHQQNRTSSDVGFDLELEGIGSLKEPPRDAGALDAIETRLELRPELRSALWVARAGRARQGGDLDRATSALDRAARLGPGNPAVLHERAMIQLARGDGAAASDSWRAAAEAAIALKADPGSAYSLLLPAALRKVVEPIVRPTGAGLAAAARRLAQPGSPARDLEPRWLLAWSEELDRDGHSARLERAETSLAFGQTQAALEAADAALAPGALPAAPPQQQYRERIEWLALRERCLRRLGNSVEANRVRDELFAVPPRDPGLGPRQIDLSRHYNASIYDQRQWHGDATMKLLAETFTSRPGLPFDIRGLVQLNSGRFPQSAAANERGKDFNGIYGKNYPASVDGIPVNLRSRALHFLVAVAHGGSAKEGTRAGQLVIHFEDGAQAECPLVLGEDVLDWALPGDMKKLSPERLAWIGGRPERMLFHRTWTNPTPERLIASFDFVSALREAAPYLVAVSAE